MGKNRLDLMLVLQGLVESREKAQRLILAGKVRVNGAVASKPGNTFPEDAVLAVEEPERFVSRGGLKLEAAFEQFHPDVTGRVCADFGASTGGFTDCLLQHGAAKVYAIDVGKSQLHPRMAGDPRVVVMDGVNVRHMKPGDLPETPSFAVVDVSFISLTLVLPAIAALLASPAGIVTLIKPQFEAGREQVGKGGVVRDPAVHQEVIARVRAFGEGETGLIWNGICESPARGPAGNIEFLAYWTKP